MVYCISSTSLLLLHSIFMVLLLLTMMVDPVKTGKRQKALFSLQEDNGKAGSNTDTLKKDRELDTLLQQTKENLIKAFGLRENMVNAGDSVRRREPHKYMTYIAKKYEETYKEGIPLTANTVRGCVDIGKNLLLVLYVYVGLVMIYDLYDLYDSIRFTGKRRFCIHRVC